MKKILVLIFYILIFFNSVKAQKPAGFTASNGVTYQEGDTIALGVGSAGDGGFEYIRTTFTSTLLMTLAQQQGFDTRLANTYQGAHVVIRKIKLVNGKQVFTFNTDEEGTFSVDIEGAIASCELAYCQLDGFLTQQQFEKLVLLYRAYQNGDIPLEKFESLRKEMINISESK